MTDWTEMSRLPSSQQYWQNLTARIQDRGHHVLSQQREWREFRTTAGWTGGLVAAAAIVLLLVSAGAQEDPLSARLSPTDPVAAALLASPRPPAIAELMSSFDEASQP